MSKTKSKKKRPQVQHRPQPRHRVVDLGDTTETTTDMTVPGEVIAVEEEKPVHVLLCTPAYGGQVTEPYFQSVLNLIMTASREGIQVSVFTVTGESLITRARNECVRVFMSDPKYTHLFFVDADIEFKYENFKRLLDSGHDVSASIYPLKTIAWDRLVGQQFDNKTALIAKTIEAVVNAGSNAPMDVKGEDGFAACLDAGTGFMMIRRSVIESMIATFPETRYLKDDFGVEGSVEAWALFDTMIDEGRYLSEDYTFCRRWQKMGGKVYVDLDSPILIHQGTYKYGKV